MNRHVWLCPTCRRDINERIFVYAALAFVAGVALTALLAPYVAAWIYGGRP